MHRNVNRKRTVGPETWPFPQQRSKGGVDPYYEKGGPRDPFRLTHVREKLLFIVGTIVFLIVFFVLIVPVLQWATQGAKPADLVF